MTTSCPILSVLPLLRVVLCLTVAAPGVLERRAKVRGGLPPGVRWGVCCGRNGDFELEDGDSMMLDCGDDSELGR